MAASRVQRSFLLEATVSALCYEVAHSLASGGEWSEEPPYNDVTEFVLGQWHRMPRFLAWPLGLATLAFACWGVATGGSFFHRSAPARRVILIESWRNSWFGPCRDLMRFYRSLAIMAFYSRKDLQS